MPVFPVMTMFPLTATVIAGAFAGVLLSRYVASRHRPHELMWGIAFLLFALGSGCQVFADVGGGWNPLVARIFYLSGAILNVGYLGVGTLYLLASRRVANIGLVVMLALTVVGTLVVFTGPVDASQLGNTDSGWKAVATLTPWPRVLAIFINTAGTILVAGGALLSAYGLWRKRAMRNRMVGVLVLGVGVLVTALGGTITGLSGLNSGSFVYVKTAIGAVIMFVGYLYTIRPEPAPARQKVPARQSALKS